MADTKEISLCNSCNCMTKTINGKCGKCKSNKEISQEEKIQELQRYKEMYYNAQKTFSQYADKQEQKFKDFVEELKAFAIVEKIIIKLNEVSEEKENEEGDNILTFDEMENPIFQVINKYIQTLANKYSGEKE
jgi:hypothetical protein